MAEGLENWFARHGRSDETLVAGLKELAFEMLVEPQYRLPMFNALRNPEGVDEAAVRMTEFREAL
jgi:aspartate aminotransferase-like enzyme